MGLYWKYSVLADLGESPKISPKHRVYAFCAVGDPRGTVLVAAAALLIGLLIVVAEDKPFRSVVVSINSRRMSYLFSRGL